MITVDDVTAALDRAAAQQPQHVDARVGRDLAARYVEHGEPCCLVAVVLADLGISLGVLRALDREARTKSEGGGGVILRKSRHKVRRRIDPVAWQLLCEVQERQDSGRPWRQVVDSVLRPTPAPWERPPDFPWLTTPQPR